MVVAKNASIFELTKLLISRHAVTCDEHQIWLENELKCEVAGITCGEILSIISLKCEQLFFEAIISDHALKGLNLAVGEQVFAYVKSTSIHVSA